MLKDSIKYFRLNFKIWTNVAESTRANTFFISMFFTEEKPESCCLVVKLSVILKQWDNVFTFKHIKYIYSNKHLSSANTTGASVTWSGQIVFKSWKQIRGQQIPSKSNKPHNTIRALWARTSTRDQFATDNWPSSTKDVGTRHRAELFFCFCFCL